MRKNVLNSPRLLELKKHRRRSFQSKILLYLVALLAVFVFLIYIFRLTSLNISEVEIIGNKVLDAEVIKVIVKKELTGNYLGFFPKTNVLLYPENNIKKELSNQFTRLKNITLFVKDRKILQISVSEREPKYLWCEVEMGLEIEKCHFIDEDGFIFDEAPYFSGEVYFKFYGATNLFEKSFEKLISFKMILENMGLKPVVLFVQENRDVKIFLSTSRGPEIIFKIDSDLEKVAENLGAALTTEPLQSNFKNKYSSLLYIDLRFGNKVYYKFQ